MTYQEYYHERPISPTTMSPFTPRASENIPAADEEESGISVDEPPDSYFSLARTSPFPTVLAPATKNYVKQAALPNDRRASLLTKALASPDWHPFQMQEATQSRPKSISSVYSTISAASTAELTSDGGLTSPARTSSPSPPLPSANHDGLVIVPHTPLEDLDNFRTMESNLLSPQVPATILKTNTIVFDDVPARKRCITFACGQPAPAKIEAVIQSKPEAESEPKKRPCTLRFACPAKPTKASDRKFEQMDAKQQNPLVVPPVDEGTPKSQQTDSKPVTKNTILDDMAPLSRFKKSAARPLDLHTSHDFAISRDGEEAWLHATPRAGKKITVADTLRKENAIRKIGEEAEAEALEEEEEEESKNEDEDGAEDNSDDDGDDMEGDEEGEDGVENSDDDVSEGGNESDNEEGFAASDDESEADPDYQFWTTGLTTAATSTDHLEHIRPRAQRNASVSSIESIVDGDKISTDKANANSRGHRGRQSRASPKMRPGTPELPDSTDFVCGTLDEDRPLEAAYLSCLEQRKLAKKSVIPQDFDPSFPTSEPEDEDDDIVRSDDQIWVIGRPDDSDADQKPGRGVQIQRHTANSPAPSPKGYRSSPPKRFKSPPPPATNKRGNCRSPPPQRLFGQSPRRLRSPPPHARPLRSPPSSRRPSLSDLHNPHIKINVPHLAQRPNLTHTKSLPRTPNPFWHEHRKSRAEAQVKRSKGGSSKTGGHLKDDIHSRGPIDIVQGLETKRLRRKEKFWRQHCRNAGKEKERRCQPGKGAERMRELGLEVADRCKAYGQRPQLMLSV